MVSYGILGLFLGNGRLRVNQRKLTRRVQVVATSCDTRNELKSLILM